MRQYFKPYDEEKWFYIRYVQLPNFELREFWSDDEKEFNKKLIFIKRHSRYELLKKRSPML